MYKRLVSRLRTRHLTSDECIAYKRESMKQMTVDTPVQVYGNRFRRVRVIIFKFVMKRN